MPLRNSCVAYTVDIVTILMARRLFPAALLALAACAEQPWSRKDASAEQLEKDKLACEEQAYREVQKRYASLPTMGPALMGDSTARRFNSYPSGPFADVFGTQLQEEARLTGECMQEKGYTREPVKPK
jgi:hypothetical protein